MTTKYSHGDLTAMRAHLRTIATASGEPVEVKKLDDAVELLLRIAVYNNRTVHELGRYAGQALAKRAITFET